MTPKKTSTQVLGAGLPGIEKSASYFPVRGPDGVVRLIRVDPPTPHDRSDTTRTN